ncbi:MAG: tRNA (adenosine(37)-N6)-dimethylallyltransferase MiaA [Pseudomonadota bacterium]|nr:tRNA (adenosine(37)-N6)-dimethylallyltransferase MiaA [Pseudomonadota bacterium]
MIPAILLMGPTAAGKSAWAVALAERFGGEIVSVDSAQIYRGMDIGTAKPDAAIRARIAHHLLDVIDPTEAYSAAAFARDALGAIADIRGRGRVPILAGGTMLYFKALAEGLSALPSADRKLRAEIDARAQREGWPALHAELARVDPQTAARLKPTDAQRIQRALEVWHLAGTPLSALQGRRGHSGDVLGPTLRIALIPSERTRLHEAIARRFDAMLAGGLVDELCALRRRYALTPDLPSMRCVGYRQAWSYLDGEIDRATLRARGVAATRQLAKRQFTWLRSTAATVLDPYQDDAFASLLALAAEARDAQRDSRRREGSA